jgi:hypothetical protein
MEKLDSVDLRKLMWRQTQFGARDFELCSRDDLVAVMYWPRWFSERAVVESADGNWHLDRFGFFRRRTVAMVAGLEAELASFEANWRGDGDLCLSSGRIYQWYKTKAFRNFWALADGAENVAFEIQAGMRRFKYEAGVVLYEGAESLPELPLLIVTAWYLAYMQIQDAAAAVAATSATTAATT